MKAYGALPASEKAMWEMKRRSHLAMQPYIRDVIVDALIRNPRESWRGSWRWMSTFGVPTRQYGGG